MSVTTPRRSGRLDGSSVAPRGSRPVSNSGICTWTTNQVYSRPSVRDDFDDDDEWEQARGGGDVNDDKEDKSMRTDFYEGFVVSGRKSKSHFYRFLGDKTVAKGKQAKAKGKGKEESYKLGDTVYVPSVNLLPSIGVIVGMWENRWENAEGEETQKMRVKVHWFLRPTELPGIRARREHTVNEIFYSLNQIELLSPNDILGCCTISGTPPSGTHTAVEVDDLHDDEGLERYYCHLAVNSQRGLFYEFNWEEHREAALNGEGDVWDVLVEEGDPRESKGKVKNEHKAQKTPVRPKKKMKKELPKKTVDVEESEVDDSADEYDGHSEEDEDNDDGLSDSTLPSPDELDEELEEEDILGEPRTPSKKRKRPTTSRNHSNSKRTPSKSTTTTPRKPKRKRVAVVPTPHSRKSLAARKQKKALRIRPPPPLTSHLQVEHLPADPWLRAMHVLHVGARPDVLPCREEEYIRCLRAVEELLEEGSGGCVYISGVPGTGKTATVHAIVRELKRMAEESETNPFTYVEINGLKLPDPTAAYSLLWEGVSGHNVSGEGHLKISAKESLKNLSRHFSASSNGVGAGAKGRGRGRGRPGGHACVVLMDELDQLVTTKQDVVYNFFNWPTLVGSKLIVLAVANTMDLPERVMSGRVRSRLGMIRINFQPYTTPQLERIVQTRLQSAKEGLEGKNKDQSVIAADGVKFAAMKVSSISGDARRVLDICRRTVEQVQPQRRTAKTDDVKEVIKVMQNSPTAAYIRDCSLHEQIMLAALLKIIKREGVEEVRWGDVQYQHLIYMNVLTGADDPTHRPTLGELDMVLDSLSASRAMLIEDGAAASRRAEADRKVILNLEQGEVERVLSEKGSRWKNALSG